LFFFVCCQFLCVFFQFWLTLRFITKPPIITLGLIQWLWITRSLTAMVIIHWSACQSTTAICFMLGKTGFYAYWQHTKKNKTKTQRNWQHTKKNKTKTQDSIYWTHYALTNTNNVKKTWVLLQKTRGKDKPNIICMWKMVTDITTQKSHEG
jgi:hypothetical protein